MDEDEEVKWFVQFTGIIRTILLFTWMAVYK